jgi:hypothetical protein
MFLYFSVIPTSQFGFRSRTFTIGLENSNDCKIGYKLRLICDLADFS